MSKAHFSYCIDQIRNTIDFSKMQGYSFTGICNRISHINILLAMKLNPMPFKIKTIEKNTTLIFEAHYRENTIILKIKKNY